MPYQTTYWVILLVISFTIMFLLVPPKQGPELSSFGFVFGLVQAVIVLWVGQSYFKLFKFVGDPTLFGIPMIVSLIWIPPAIVFAKYFHLANTLLKKGAYILVFATGSALGQYALDLLGMFASVRWNPFDTFLLATVTHSIMTVYLILRKNKFGSTF